ncbi:MAG: hypothetical protein ABIP17_13910 [Ilumatobacteraceae bacterium]
MNEPMVRLRAAVLEQLRVLAVAGISVGVVVVGVGSRLAMLALRLTSPDSVIGVQSDDDFTIGEFTLGGTYNLLMIGSLVGIIGVAAYQLVVRKLVGPSWFQRVTLAAGSGAVVGSMLVHADGIDFRVLKPMWFAVGLFVALPALFAVAIGPVVDRVGDPLSWTTKGRARWLLPVVLVVLFPLTVFLLVFAAAVFTVWAIVRERTSLPRLTHSRGGVIVAQVGWFAIASVGLLSLIGDILDLS